MVERLSNCSSCHKLHFWCRKRHLCRFPWWLQVTTKLQLSHNSSSSLESQRKQRLLASSNSSLELDTSNSSLKLNTSNSSLESERKQLLSASASICLLATHTEMHTPAFFKPLKKIFWQPSSTARFVKSLHFSVTFIKCKSRPLIHCDLTN